jgi:putative flippase GtrA
MHKQFLRYAIVGISSNIILYLAYLLLTGFGLGHKTAMTLLYAVGILQTFLLNRHWTFGHQGSMHSAFARYVIVYFLGYLVNFSGLYVFVDVLGFAHQLIQGMMIILVAVLLFALQRLWVFNRQDEIPGYMPGQGNP